MRCSAPSGGLQDQRRGVTPAELCAQEVRPAEGGQPFDAAGQGG